jgi:hypothetical protein
VQGHVDESGLVPLELDAHDAASVEPEEDVAGGDLLADSLFAEVAPSGAAILPPRRRGFRGLWDDRFRSRRPRASQWDSPLLLVGGGVLIVLLFVGVGLLFYLLRGSGDELYELAENDYRDLAYSQAIAKYEKFLAGFPSHPKASEARVRKVLARLRQAVDNA